MKLEPYLLALRAGLASLLAAAACAASAFTISLDTTVLIGHPAAPFYIEFQLNDGSGTGNGNNTALIGSFDFDGGAPVGSPLLVGGASGDLSSHVVIGDSDFLNEFIQQFTPGALLTFDVELSAFVEPGPQPDQFSFAILDCNLIEVPTRGPADALVIADITDPTVPRSYAADTSRMPSCGGPALDLRVLSPPLTQPAPLALLGAAFVAWLGVARLPGMRARRRLGIGHTPHSNASRR